VIAFLESVCERIAQGLDHEARALSMRLEGVDATTAAASIDVAPHDASFSSVDVNVNAETGLAYLVTLVPSQPVFLRALEQVFGRCHWSPSMPFAPRKFAFTRPKKPGEEYVVRFTAYVDPPARTSVDATPVEKLLMSWSAASDSDNTLPVAPCPLLVGGPVSFRLRLVNTSPMDDVRRELEDALGVELVDFECSLASCNTRLSSSVSDNVFDLVGVPRGDSGATISDGLAAYLQSKHRHWYVPHELELLEDRGELGDRILDRGTLTNLLASRLLSGLDGEDRESGWMLLAEISEMMIAAARRTVDPVAAVRSRKANFINRTSYMGPPSSRARRLAADAVLEQLYIIEDETFELNELPPVELAARPGVRERLAEWREMVVALTDVAKETNVEEQHRDVLATIDRLLRDAQMAAQWARIVLGEPNENELVAIAGKNNWGLRNFNAKTADQPAERIYATRDRATQIHWIDDHKIGVVYIYVQGAETSQVEALLRAKLAHYSSKTIVERARNVTLAPADRRDALYHLALDKMDRGFDQETFDIYKRAMQDPDPFVRGSAVLGSAYLGWPQLAEPMRLLATTAEPDESIRKDAATLVDRLDDLQKRG
jgi:hypothetical protein